MKLSKINLTPNEYQDIEKLLAQQGQDSLSLEDIWQLMDKVWDELGCDNEHLNWEKVGLFYAHPIWVLNGLFIEQDSVSMLHRQAISQWISDRTNIIHSVVDYGGGFGTLARVISDNGQDLTVDIFEPFPSEIATRNIALYQNIHLVSLLNKKYDCLVSTDVLEHVENPLQVFSEMINAVNTDGYLIIANCFHPVIKCHLPSTFHLRYTFNIFAKIMGLRVIGNCKDSHATIYKKERDQVRNLFLLKIAEMISKAIFPLRETARNIKNKLLK
jgi:2-polyprenyl-3-methyl-5-hydroxy-6-metoxy-1,4-benzoquinol methylase